MTQQQVMRDLIGQSRVFETRSHPALFIAHEGNNPWIVECNPLLHAITKAARNDISIVGEGRGCLTAAPTTYAILECLRQVPVVERDKWRDVDAEECIDELFIKIEAGRVLFPLALWENARPRDREAIGVHAQLLHHLNIFTPAVIMVIGNLAGLVVEHIACNAAKAVPDRFTTPIFSGCAFDLIGSGRDSPGEIFWNVYHPVSRSFLISNTLNERVSWHSHDFPRQIGTGRAKRY